MSKYQYLIENKDLSVPGALTLTLKPKNVKDIFTFKPGQYAMLSFYNKTGKFFINHPFSIASSPTDSGFLKFGIKILGKFTQNLQNLELGGQVEILGPFGNFVFNPKKHQEAVFIAGGVGITPFISAIKYATDKGLSNKINLLYSVRTLKDALFYEDIKKLASINSNFSAKLKITQEIVSSDSIYCESGYITKETILENIGSVATKDFFICGPSQFMKAMASNLLALGVPSKKIYQEAFSVVPDLSFRKNFPNIFLAYGLSAAVFLGFLNFIVPESKEPEIKKSSVDLINNTINSRRNSIIDSKQLLLNTINSVKGTTIVAPNKQPSVVAPVYVPTKIPVVTTPVVNTPVVIPAPTTRVS